MGTVNTIIEQIKSGDLAIPASWKAEDARAYRNSLLEETDWWAVADRTMTQAEIDYRQALRDVPQQAGFPHSVTWPTKP